MNSSNKKKMVEVSIYQFQRFDCRLNTQSHFIDNVQDRTCCLEILSKIQYMLLTYHLFICVMMPVSGQSTPELVKDILYNT